MLKTLSKSGNILKNNFLFVQPILVCLFFIMTAMTYILARQGAIIPRIMLLLCTIMFSIAFLAGCLYINKLGVISYNPNEANEVSAEKSINNFKKFFEGIGCYVTKVLSACIIFGLIYGTIIFLITKMCMSAFGEPKLIHEFSKFIKASSQTEIINIINSVSDVDKMIFSSWVLVFNTVTAVLNYLFLIYCAVISFDNNNIFISLFKTIGFFSKNIFESIFIMIVVFVLYIALNIISMVVGTGSIGIVILMILFSLYLNYYLILVFCFYYDKTKNNSDSRSECFG